MYRKVESSTTQYTTKSTVRARIAKTNIVASLVIVVMVAFVAAFLPRTAMAAEQLPTAIEAVWDAQVANNTMAIFAFNTDGELHVYYFAGIVKNGVPLSAMPDQPFEVPTANIKGVFGINVWISNPKICWTLTDGTPFCVVY